MSSTEKKNSDMKVCYIIYKYNFKWFLAIAAALFCSSLRVIGRFEHVLSLMGIRRNEKKEGDPYGMKNVVFDVRNFDIAEKDDISYSVGFVGKKGVGKCEKPLHFEDAWRISLQVEEAKDGNPDVVRQETRGPIKEEEKPIKFLPPLTLKW
nr:hypothetical protein [Tanacetum cinerariifolium]